MVRAVSTGAGASTPVLELDGLVTHFPVRSKLLRRQVGAVHAVDGVDLTVSQGETVGLVGESGCGKSTLARTVIGLNKPTAGRIVFDGKDVTGLKGKRMRRHRRDMQLVFQDSYGSLNPRMRLRDIVAEPLIAYKLGSREGIRQRVSETMELVGLDASQADRYPHQFSGGQRQRIGIARALVLRPKLLILDEPVSALDVSIQAQILNLLQDLQAELNFACLLIAHDLAVVRHIAHRVAVMYLGKVMEIASSDELYDRPTHPYTKVLLSAVPIPDPERAGSVNDVLLEGDLPSPTNPPSGCRFRTRCWKADERCAQEVPELVFRAGVEHPSACHYAAVDEEPVAMV